MALIHSAPAAAQTASFDDRRAVRFWLVTVASLVFLMVLVGGATRLTESGLSITQWKPVTGAASPAERGGVAGRVRPLQANPAIRPAQSRHDAGRVQGHLLVGMGASPAGARRRRGIHSARLMVLVARPAQGRTWAAGRRRDRPACARADRRLVDGVLGLERAHRGGAGAPGAASPDRRRDVRRPDLRRGGLKRTPAVEDDAARLCDFRLDLRGNYHSASLASARSSRACAPASSTTPGRSWDRALFRARRFAQIRCKRSSAMRRRRSSTTG